jgi:hypothetical protein
VQETLKEASGRFPPELKYVVQFDTTTFVTDTVKEVMRTLGEAFVLVVLVVFLFLGSLRATIIPTVAVPVSLIGTFAVLLAVGYSANTVSLLAMVLAIGIVVDDAIVVVENVERVMEEHPDLSPADATKKAMAQITAPVIATRRLTMYLATLVCPISTPSLRSSPWIRGAPHSGLAMLISRISLRISSGTVGLPPRAFDFHRQYKRKPARCHLTNLSSLTIASASRTPGRSR